MELIFLTLILGATVLLAFYITKIFKSEVKEEIIEVADHEVVTKKDPLPAPGPAATKSKKKPEKKSKEKDTFKHPWLVTSLKGHSGRVMDLDISSNGKYLATCGEDQTVMVWSTKEFSAREHKPLRCNVEFDHGLFVKWSPDSKAFVVQKAMQNCTEVYKMAKKADGSLGDFSVAVSFPKVHLTDVIGMGMAATGKFIATCNDKTELLVWSLKGDVLAKLDTCHNLTYCCKVSPCGRFVATSGFTPDVKVWEVKFSRSGDFEKAARAFDLTGHRSGVYSFAFSADSGKMATVSKDGSWKLFDTAIEFSRGQDAEVLVTGSYPWDSNQPSLIALSPDGLVVAIAQDRNIAFFSATTGECTERISEPHSEPVTSMIFDSSSAFLITAGDKHVRVFHNVPGKLMQIEDLKIQLKKNMSNSTAKARIEGLIRDAEEELSTFTSQA